MNSRTGFFRALAIGALTLGFTLPLQAQVDFSRYVVVGDSLAAGYLNGSLVETHQRNSLPALIAGQAGATDFEQPLISEPGMPAELVLHSLSPVVILPKPGLGSPINLGLPRPYNNLAVPGATALDALETTSGDLHDVVLRGLGTQIEQAIALQPTFISLWIGNNDVLGAVIAGRAVDGETMTPTQVFRIVYAAVVANLSSTGATIVAANIPNVADIPYASAIPPVVIDPSTGRPLEIDGRMVPLYGEGGILELNAKVTLAASPLLSQGIGIPREVGGLAYWDGFTCMNCLPDEAYLTGSELAFIQDHVRVNNASIQEICGAAGIPVVDINALLAQAADEGLVVGGVTYTADFLTGGMFSYDGVHPSPLGYAIAANEWIRVIDQNGGSLGELSLYPFMGLSARSRRPGGIELSREAWENLLAVFGRVDR